MNKTNLLYQVMMERFWGLKEVVGLHSNVDDAIKALQVKKAIVKKTYPEAVFTIVTIKES